MCPGAGTSVVPHRRSGGGEPTPHTTGWRVAHIHHPSEVGPTRGCCTTDRGAGTHRAFGQPAHHPTVPPCLRRTSQVVDGVWLVVWWGFGGFAPCGALGWCVGVWVGCVPVLGCWWVGRCWGVWVCVSGCLPSAHLLRGSFWCGERGAAQERRHTPVGCRCAVPARRVPRAWSQGCSTLATGIEPMIPASPLRGCKSKSEIESEAVRSRWTGLRLDFGSNSPALCSLGTRCAVSGRTATPSGNGVHLCYRWPLSDLTI